MYDDEPVVDTSIYLDFQEVFHKGSLGCLVKKMHTYSIRAKVTGWIVS